ncbi:MAG: DUF4340 domain-containing protein [Deltaproteobacteria bacterium]|nr:DUF4340 domain-containing protein [Deltaproteobacteria bacterium]
MKKKLEYILLAAVILAAGAYLMFRQADRTRYTLPKLPEMQPGAVTRMEITRKDRRIFLEKSNDGWRVSPGGFSADEKKVNDLLDALAKLILSAQVSESKNYARYDLGEEKRIHVKTFAGKTLKRDLAIGSTASTFRHTHVKIAGDPHVYQAQGNLKSKFNVTVEGLRDKTVLSFDPARVREVLVTTEDTSVKIVKRTAPETPSESGEKTQGEKSPESKNKGVVWETEGGQTVDSTKFMGVLSALSALECQSYIDDRKKEDFKDPSIEIVIRGEKEHVLKFFSPEKKDSRHRPGLSSDNPDPFLIADHQIQDLQSFVKSLEPPEAAK